MTNAYPLHWPPGWKRSKHRLRSNFGQGTNRSPLTHSRALSNLITELDRLKAKKVVLSTNLELRLDGLPMAGRRIIDDPGVVVYFELNKKEQCIPCDKWDRVEDNMHAIAKTIDALRGIERWGAKEMVDAAFSGFQALPDYTNSNPIASIEMGVKYFSDCVDKEHTKHRYKTLVKALHPDNGGNPEEFKDMLNQYNKLVGEHFGNL